MQSLSCGIVLFFSRIGSHDVGLFLSHYGDLVGLFLFSLRQFRRFIHFLILLGDFRAHAPSSISTSL
jgi:hypothetical protein